VRLTLVPTITRGIAMGDGGRHRDGERKSVAESAPCGQHFIGGTAAAASALVEQHVNGCDRCRRATRR
jgi:hypothetical protein